MRGSGAADLTHHSDIRFFRERARDERRRIHGAANARMRRIHHEMAEHYELVADLLEAKTSHEPGSLAASLRRMLDKLRY